jgi:PAS domain S-box
MAMTQHRHTSVEELLGQNSNFLTAILDDFEDGIFALDKNWCIIYINKRAAGIAGLKPLDLIGRNIWDSFPQIKGTTFEDNYRRAMHSQVKQHFDKSVSGNNWYTVNVYPSVEGILVYWQDITERKKAEEALKRSEEQARQRAEELQKLMEIIPAAVWVSNDPECKVIFGNQTANTFYEAKGGENVSAGPTSDIKHDKTRRFFLNGRELLPSELPMQQAAAKKKEIKNAEVDVLTPSGGKRTLLGNAIPLLNNEGKVRGCLGAFVDITERKMAEEALRQWTEQLEQIRKELERKAAEVEQYATRMESLAEERAKKLQASERLAAIGATAGMVGHDIRNPLQAITCDVYLLKDYLSAMPDIPTKHDVAESLEGIERNVGYINKIVADLQDFSKQISPELKEVNLYELVAGAFRTIEIPNNVEPLLEMDPKIRVKTDSTLFTRILSNLVINAIQAMPNGGKLSITAAHTLGRLTLSIEDTGVGIPENVKPKLFTPMMTTKAKGQGLGLAVVKRLVEALKGTISFESQEGKGTKFTITLPMKD